MTDRLLSQALGWSSALPRNGRSMEGGRLTGGVEVPGLRAGVAGLRPAAGALRAYSCLDEQIRTTDGPRLRYLRKRLEEYLESRASQQGGDAMTSRIVLFTAVAASAIVSVEGPGLRGPLNVLTSARETSASIAICGAD